MIIKKIAILRANALGDFLITLPAIEAIRAKYPQAEIVLLGAPWHKEFLVKGRCAVDRVEVVPETKGIRGNNYASPEELALFFNKMQEEKFDVALHFQGNGISANPFILNLKAKITAGCTTENAAALSRSIPFYYYQNEISRYLEVASLIGASPVTLEGTINIFPVENEQILSFLKLMDHQKFIVLHPFSTDKRREWPLENYPFLADALFERGYQVIYTGLEKDRIATDSIIQKMKHEALNAAGKLPLGSLAALLKKASMIIAPDTGPLHLARTVKTPTTGIYWAPNFLNWSPMHRKHDHPVISWKMECPLCGVVPNDPYPFFPQSSCTHEVSFVRDITAEKVLKAAEQVLGHKVLENENNCMQSEKLSQSSA